MTLIHKFVFFFALIMFVGCAAEKVHYFNNDQIIQSDFASTGVCEKVGFNCVVMSEGSFRAITSINQSLQVVTLNSCSQDNLEVK